jgi:chemotaxis protein methyltransferase CheR
MNDLVVLPLLRDLIQARCGIHFPPEQQDDLLRAVEQTMEQTGYDDPSLFYYHLLNTSLHDPVWRHLIHQVTIEETYFFRNHWQFLALREQVLPELIKQRRREGNFTLRLWSAGCSSGEEPYTLAILLRELLPDIDLWRILLLATDINEFRLQRARQGQYGSWSFRNETPDSVREKYFIRQEDAYEIIPEVRRMVRFEYLNLVEDVYPALSNDTINMDIIICRNVTIYFERSTTQTIVNRFFQALMDGGWLIVGHAEPLASIYRGYEVQNFPNAVFYRKPLEWVKPPTQSKPAVVPALDKALQKLPPPSPPTHADQIDEIYALMLRGDTQGARRALSTFLEVMPDHTDALFLLAKMTADEGRSEDVHDILDMIDTLNPLVPQAHYLRALLYQQSSSWDEAKAALRRALYADRNFILAHYYMGELLYTEGKIEMARRSWRNALEILKTCEPNSPVAFGDGLLVGTLLHAIEQRLKSL